MNFEMNLEDFSVICRQAIVKFKMEFPKDIFSDNKEHSVEDDRCIVLFESLDENGDLELDLLPWEEHFMDMARGYLMGLGVSREESFYAQIYIKNNDFWMDE